MTMIQISMCTQPNPITPTTILGRAKYAPTFFTLMSTITNKRRNMNPHNTRPVEIRPRG